jgi:hypothetical protein
LPWLGDAGATSAGNREGHDFRKQLCYATTSYGREGREALLFYDSSGGGFSKVDIGGVTQSAARKGESPPTGYGSRHPITGCPSYSGAQLCQRPTAVMPKMLLYKSSQPAPPRATHYFAVIDQRDCIIAASLPAANSTENQCKED